MEKRKEPRKIQNRLLCGFPCPLSTELACDRKQGLFAAGLANGVLKMYAPLYLPRRWSLWGGEVALDLHAFGKLTHVQFFTNQGLIAAAFDARRIRVFSINNQSAYGEELVLPEDE